MKNITDLYRQFCENKRIYYQLDDNVRPYDNTTLFCPAGMQQFKQKFKSDETGTQANIQSCIRLNDLEEIGDGTHFLYFDMVGLFSFRTMSIQTAVDFWMEFVENVLEIKVDYVTIHPDKMEEWRSLYDNYDVEVRSEEECKWTDGDIGGYCTEFFKDDVEIGNIVNPLGTCIDAGFGLQRLDMFVNGPNEETREEILIQACEKLLMLISTSLAYGFLDCASAILNDTSISKYIKNEDRMEIIIKINTTKDNICMSVILVKPITHI